MYVCLYVLCILVTMPLLLVGYRLATLNAIADTVTEFDTVKSPLEQWVFDQQEYYSKLPLLETDPSELRRQKEEFEAALRDLVSREKEVESLMELSEQFIKGKEVRKWVNLFSMVREHKKLSVAFVSFFPSNPIIERTLSVICRSHLPTSDSKFKLYLNI